MSKSKSNLFEIDFDSYILQSEPAKQENGNFVRLPLVCSRWMDLHLLNIFTKLQSGILMVKLLLNKLSSLLIPIIKLAREEQKTMIMQKKLIRFLFASVKFLQKKLSALLPICCFQFIKDFFLVFSTR